MIGAVVIGSCITFIDMCMCLEIRKSQSENGKDDVPVSAISELCLDTRFPADPM